jgi:hypothetical protein
METLYLKNIVPKIRGYLKFLELERVKPVSFQRKCEATTFFIQVLKSLEEFCLNKIYFSNPENNYGHPNPFRQKYMRELYILDLMVEILKIELPKYECEEVFKSSASTMSFLNKTRLRRALLKSGANDKNGKGKGSSMIGALSDENKPSKLKINICNVIFRAMSTICNQNNKNQVYFYKRVPEILYFGKYLITATDCFNSILKGNSNLLNQLTNEIRLNMILMQSSKGFQRMKTGYISSKLFLQ